MCTPLQRARLGQASGPSFGKGVLPSRIQIMSGPLTVKAVSIIRQWLRSVAKSITKLERINVGNIYFGR